LVFLHQVKLNITEILLKMVLNTNNPTILDDPQPQVCIKDFAKHGSNATFIMTILRGFECLLYNEKQAIF
jgi:hypothetical protein